MNVALAYSHRDHQACKELLEWIKELGGCPNHTLLLCHEGVLDKAIVEPISERAQAAFGKVNEIIAHANIIDEWPMPHNYMWRTCTAAMSYKTDVRYFLWMEPDAIPIVPGWLELIEKEFIACKKPFMGARVEVKNIPLHMSGIGVYPNPLYEFAGEAYRATDEAFDMAGKDQIIPRAHWTNLIEHAWKHPAFQDPSELVTQMNPNA